MSETQNTNPANRIQRAEIFLDTWDGVKVKLQSLYSKDSGVCDRDIQVVPTGNSDNVESLLQQKGMHYELPIIAISLLQVETNTGSYNPHILRREGYHFSIDKGRQWWTFIKAYPCLLTFQATLVTDDMLTLLKMVERWMINETWGVQVRYPGWAANIKITADKALSIPQRLPGAGGSEQYKLTTNLKVESYAGYSWLVPAIRAVQIDSAFPKGALETALNDGVTMAEAIQTGKYNLAADGTLVMTRFQEGATDPAHIAIPYEPAF